MSPHVRRSPVPITLALIVLGALVVRLHNYRFGLPSLWDPDEPIFMMKAVEMLSSGDPNPRWFGHPGSTTIYLVALTNLLTVGSALLTGTASLIDQFIRAAYGDPGLLFGPARLAMVFLGTLAVLLTYVVGRRLFGPAAALVAAALLAANSLHIAWSQVIRTDIQASLFMLGALYFAAGAAERGGVRDYLFAGLMTGFATATKWPAAVIFAAVAGAFAFGSARRGAAGDAKGLALGALAVVAGLFVASPFIFLDWQTVLANVGGEVKSGHLAQNGGGLFENLGWYLEKPIAGSMGWLGVALALAGAVQTVRRYPVAAATLLPAAAIFLILISSQDIIYSRWLLPALPLLCMLVGVAVQDLGGAIARRFPALRPERAIGIVAMLAFIPSAVGAVGQRAERANDTRGQAARWAAANIPAGSRVLIEHLEFSLRGRPWTFLFPLGGAGCVDGEKMLSDDISYEQVQALRQGCPIIDIGNVVPAKLDSCAADYAILTYYDLQPAKRTCPAPVE